jgi:hypothetical protein
MASNYYSTEMLSRSFSRFDLSFFTAVTTLATSGWGVCCYAGGGITYSKSGLNSLAPTCSYVKVGFTTGVGG